MPRVRLAILVEFCLSLALCACGGGGGAAERVVSVSTSSPTGSPPVVLPGGISTLEDHPVRAKLRATDAEGDALTFAIDSAPEHATISLDAATGEYELQPAANYFGPDAFGFTVTDGHGHSTPGRVEVTVTPVRDPPSIDASKMASVVAAGQNAQLSVSVTDPDGDAVTVSVSQAGGEIPLTNLAATDHDVRFLAPDVGAATTVALLLEVTDQTGLTAHTREVITLSPVSPSGKLFTLRGSPDSAGLHWIITGDGFTADEQQDLLRAALAMSKSIAEAPELARHAQILNVHVLSAVSLESGVTMAGTSRARRTAFGATLGCTDVERVACVNWDRIHVALLAEGAPFDEVAVVLNTSLYVGSTTSSGLIVSRNANAPAITLHEMGHLLAGLGDEYVDANVANGLTSRYREGKFPNVTTTADPARIPWRYWFTDAAHIPDAPGQTGVGRFEGAYYSASGFYRPKNDSVMRTLGTALGEVNAEAWLRALYRAVPPMSSASPSRRFVAGPSGASIEFQLVSPWPPELMAVRWFVDDLEVKEARDSYRHLFMADGQSHLVRVSIEDASGSIRAPDATEHRGSASWVVTTEPRVETAKAQVQSPRIAGWIRMHVDSSGHSLLGLSSGVPQRARTAGGFVEQEFEYTLFDSAGVVLSGGQVEDPRVIQGLLESSDGAVTGHAVRTLQSGDYLIGIPAGAEPHKLRIRKLDGSMEKAAQSEQWLDL